MSGKHDEIELDDFCPACGTSEPETLCIDAKTLQVTHCEQCRKFRNDPEATLRNHADAVQAFERVYFSSLITRYPKRREAARAAAMTEQGLRNALRRLFPQQPIAPAAS